MISSDPSRRRPRVLLLAYACSPCRGSEPGVGWNRALQSARHFDTWVICEQREFAAGIERYTAQRGRVAGLEFAFVPFTAWEELLGRIPGIGYLGYNLWHRRAFRTARRLHQRLRFDLVHQINLCGFREPGYLWKLDAPFVWGPVGGTQNYPWRFLPTAGLYGALWEAARSTLNNLQLRFSPRVRRAARKAALLLAANSTNQRDMARVHGVNILRTPDVGTEHVATTLPPRSPESRSFRILWVGRLEHYKALHVLIEALGSLPASISYELRVIGKGPLENRWRRLADRRGVGQRCQWLGWLPREEVLRQYDWADVFVFTSLRDTTGTVVLEALSRGTPVIGFNHQGVGDVVTDDCGIKIPVVSRQQAVAGFREAILSLQKDPAKRQRLRHGALARAREYHWSRQGDRLASLYRRILQGDAVVSLEEGILDGECNAERTPTLVAGGAGGDLPSPAGHGSLTHEGT